MADQGEHIHNGWRGVQTIGHAGHVGFRVIPGGKTRLTWATENGRFVFESSDSIGSAAWLAINIRPVQVSQVMVVGFPIGENGMRFFHV